MTRCGIDFGTSNSTVALPGTGAPRLVALEDAHLNIPSTLFYDVERKGFWYGRAAIERYVEGDEGRLMRSLKSVLGSELMNEKTQLGNQKMAFSDILGRFIKHLKGKAEAQAGEAMETVVAGRPVFFVDGDAAADKKAEKMLEKIYRAQGFKQVMFQYEPIAAAMNHELTLEDEQLALVVDIGGGTSDFAVVRLSPARRELANRAEDILASGGVHIGGTDFDYRLSTKQVMPHFGLGDVQKSDGLPLASTPYFDLATWHRINNLYTPKTHKLLEQMHKDATFPEKVARLLRIVEMYKGHALALQVEQGKIALTDAERTQLLLDWLDDSLVLEISRRNLEDDVAEDVLAIEKALLQTLLDAEVSPTQINVVITTGGSTAMPVIQALLHNRLPQARHVATDRFGSVGLGLGLQAGKL